MNMKFAAKTAITIFLLGAITGCFGVAPTQVPMPAISFAGDGDRQSTLVIMLPGRGDRADTFVKKGFHEAGRRFGFDTVAVDAHFGYYMQRSLIPRLHEDIVLPAREAGYESIWLLGISMGGFGSAMYASEYPEQVDGVILLAPFLGDADVIREIAADGGLRAWRRHESELKSYEIAMWSWIDDVTSDGGRKPLILGYGLSDRLAGAYGVLLEVLDPSSVYTLEGGHNWSSWQPLWERIAADLDL